MKPDTKPNYGGNFAGLVLEDGRRYVSKTPYLRLALTERLPIAPLDYPTHDNTVVEMREFRFWTHEVRAKEHVYNKWGFWVPVEWSNPVTVLDHVFNNYTPSSTVEVKR